MPKSTVADWSTTAANNTDVGGINIDTGCPVQNIDNALREMMAQVAAQYGSRLITTIVPDGSVGTYDVTGLGDYYEIDIFNVGLVTSSAQTLLMRLGTGAGPTFATGATDYLYSTVGQGASGGASAVGSSISLTETVTSRNFFTRLIGFNKAVQTYCTGWSATATTMQARWGNRQTAEVNTAIRLFIPSGTFNSGAVRIYGRKG